MLGVVFLRMRIDYIDRDVSSNRTISRPDQHVRGHSRGVLHEGHPARRNGGTSGTTIRSSTPEREGKLMVLAP